jgi:hypothetical protein
MNKLPWLKPLLTLVVALALGAGMLVLGTSFAPHQQVAVESGTETVPVVAPIAIGNEEPAADAESEQLAEREVRLPGAVVDGLDPSVQALIDELAASADPTYDITVLDGESEGDDSSVGDDSCAPREGDPADCPDGIRSTILPLIHLRDFNAGVEMFPPGGVYGNLLEVCDPETLNPTDGSIPVGIVATAPGAFNLEFWQTADSGAPHVEVSVNTPDDQRAAFETAVATAESVDDVPIMKFCLTVAGLEPNTAYTGVLTGLADDLRVMRPHTFRFNTTGDPVHPGLQLVPIGENLLFASALHPDDETVDIRAFVVDAGTLPSCALTTGQIFPLTWADTTVDTDRLNALNVEATFRQQHSETFRVAPGATVVVCARWFEDGSDTTSWEREQSIYESSAIAQSPDRMVPTLTITDWHDGTASPLQGVQIEVATAEGVACGGTWWTPEDTSGATGESAIVCRPGNVATSGIQLDGDRVWDLGFTGDLVVRGQVDVESGFSESSILLPAVDAGCRGACVIPADRTYRMTMAGVTVDLVESWQPSGGNGQSAWNFTATFDDAPEFVRPDLPQLDTNEEWTFDTATPARPYVAARYHLMVDRPVDYVIRLTQVPGVADASCAGTGVLEVSGHTDSEATISMPGVCLGGFYYAEAVLTDADGVSASWGLVDRSSWWGRAGIVSAPLLPVTIRYTLDAYGHSFSRVNNLLLLLDSYDSEVVNGRGGLCSQDGIVEGSGAFDAELGAHPTVTFRIQLRDSGSWTADDCSHDLSDEPAETTTVQIDMLDLYRPEGAVIHVDGRIDADIVLRAGPRS